MPQTYGNMFVGIEPCENCRVPAKLDWHDGWLCEVCYKAVEEALVRIAKERELLVPE